VKGASRSQLLPQARSNSASNPAHTDAPRSATRSLSCRVSPDREKLAEPVRRRRMIDAIALRCMSSPPEAEPGLGEGYSDVIIRVARG
jgi:hypothetical protein